MADKIAINSCDLREGRSLKFSEMAELEFNLPEGPLNTPSWIENIQIVGVRFEFSNSKNLEKPSFFLSKLCRKYNVNSSHGFRQSLAEFDRL